MTTTMILTKWNGITVPADIFEIRRVERAREACSTLAKIEKTGRRTIYTNLATTIARLSRTALLTLAERQAIFGDAVEYGLIQRIVEGDPQSIICALLDRIEEGNIPAAEKLICDLTNNDWWQLGRQWYECWEYTHSADAAVVCILSNKFARFPIDLDQMLAIAKEKRPALLQLIS